MVGCVGYLHAKGSTNPHERPTLQPAIRGRYKALLTSASEAADPAGGNRFRVEFGCPGTACTENNVVTIVPQVLGDRGTDDQHLDQIVVVAFESALGVASVQDGVALLNGDGQHLVRLLLFSPLIDRLGVIQRRLCSSFAAFAHYVGLCVVVLKRAIF